MTRTAYSGKPPAGARRRRSRFAATCWFGGLCLQQLERLLERDRLWIDMARDRGEQALVTYIGAVAASAHRHRLTVPGMITETAATATAGPTPFRGFAQKRDG